MPIQVLPYVPSALEQLTPYINQAAQGIGVGLEKRRNMREWERFITPQEAQSTPAASGERPNGNGPAQAQPNISQSPAMSPLDKMINKPGGPSLGEIQAIIGAAEKANPGSGQVVADYISNKVKSSEKRDLQERKFEQKRSEKAEPELLERETKLNHYEQEGARFERLEELFSPDLEDKFPSSVSVGLMTKDGELRPTAMALLSPEAQEAVKLVADNLSGAKDTFGARVTNFDLQAYMKRLPTLLNSAEGRRRVLRDLRLMNKLNTMHEQGVLEIVDREGGPEKISLSQAERRYRKENAQQIEKIKKEFVSPEKHTFSNKEDADPKVYSGRVVVDEKTGERFRSNGKEWVPE